MIEAGTILQNRYLIQKQIGQGGMGTVYIATDQRFNSTVAVKETIFTDADLRRAFEREAQLLNSLRHPALPRVSDHFIEGDGQFLVMEYIAGEDLAEMVIRSGAFAVADVLRWADQLLDALNYLHTQRMPVIHRDIKPQNLKLTQRGDIVLLDFGLAKGSVSELSQLSMTKSVFGYSRSYAPLEQIQGTGTDPRSDFYSLAATLYHLLTGKPPVDALTRATAVLSADSDPLVPAHQLNPKVKVAVSQVLHQAMALNPKSRPATAAKMRFALTEAMEQPDDEQTFVPVEAFPVAAELFTQNTKLMNDAGKTVGLRASGNTNPENEKVSTDPNPEKPRTQFEEATKTSVAGAPVSVVSSANPAHRFSSAKSFGIAAVILLLGGLSFAFFSGALTPQTVNSTNPQMDFAVTNAAPIVAGQKENVEAVKQPEANSAETPNTVVAKPHPEPNPQPAESKIPPVHVAAENGKTTVVKEKNTQAAAQNPKSKVKVVTDGEWVDLEKIEKNIEKELERVKDVGTVTFESIPPELRSNDPRNPVDKEKLKIYIKKQQEEAKRHQEETKRRLQEANRERKARGLPPIPHPAQRYVVVTPEGAKPIMKPAPSPPHQP